MDELKEEKNEKKEKKEWQAPDLRILDIEATRGGSGQAGADNNYQC